MVHNIPTKYSRRLLANYAGQIGSEPTTHLFGDKSDETPIIRNLLIEAVIICWVRDGVDGAKSISTPKRNGHTRHLQ